MPFIRKNTTKRRRKTGGKAIAAGGFGCVFDPVIPCNLSKTIKKITPKTSEPLVTKMLFSADAYDEGREAERIYKAVKSIPKNQNYFLFPTVECKPERFTESDLVDYTEKCSKMSRNFPKKQLLDGSALNGVSILNMPNGGMDLHNYIKKIGSSPTICAYVIAGLANLIDKAVIPMNKKNICHADLKGENIMINVQGKLKIIDWGLGGIVSESRGSVRASFLKNRPFQFNSPFTLPFIGGFKTYFDATSPARQLQLETSSSPNDVNIAQIVNSYLINQLSFNLSGSDLPGHLGYIEQNYAEPILGCCISGRDRIQSAKNTYRQLILNYISEAVSAFTDKGKFMNNEYLKKVFIPNADLWGVLVTLYSFLDKSITGVKEIEKNAITMVIKEYLFSSKYAAKPMPSKEIVKSLKLIAVSILKGSNINESRAALPIEWQNNLVEWLSDSSFALQFTEKSKAVEKSKTTVKKKPAKKATTVKRSPVGKKSSTPKRKSRCPNGTRRNKKTGNCEPV